MSVTHSRRLTVDCITCGNTSAYLGACQSLPPVQDCAVTSTINRDLSGFDQARAEPMGTRGRKLVSWHRVSERAENRPAYISLRRAGRGVARDRRQARRRTISVVTSPPPHTSRRRCLLVGVVVHGSAWDDAFRRPGQRVRQPVAPGVDIAASAMAQTAVKLGVPVGALQRESGATKTSRGSTSAKPWEAAG